MAFPVASVRVVVERVTLLVGVVRSAMVESDFWNACRIWLAMESGVIGVVEFFFAMALMYTGIM
jgi:hypothetical protein